MVTTRALSMFREHLRTTLSQIDSFATFSTGGVAEALRTAEPGLRIDGVDHEIAFPVNSLTTAEIKKVAKAATFGNTFDTFVDESVQKAWHIDAKLISFENPEWDESIHYLANFAASELGGQSSVTPVLCRAVIYESGGHFEPNKDTEKDDKMFGTLVVQLPSDCTGGELVARYQKQVRKYDFGQATGTAMFIPHYAAHYADVEHALLRVTRGSQFILIYSLCWNGSNVPSWGQGPWEARFGELTRLLSEWVDMDDFTLCSCPVGIALGHESTRCSNIVDGLQLEGRDFVLQKALKEVNSNLDDSKKVKLYIATLSGYLTWARNKYAWNSIEVQDVRVSNEVETWFDTDGNVVPSVLKFDFANLIDLDIDHFTGYEEEYEFYMNEDWWSDYDNGEEELLYGGATFISPYTRYAMIIYPERTEFHLVLEQRGVDSAASYVQRSLEVGKTSLSENDLSRATQQYKEIVEHWKDESSNSKTGIVLADIVISLNNVDLALEFVQHIKTKKINHIDERVLLKLVQFFKWAPLATALRPLLRKLSSFTSVADLLCMKLIKRSDPIVKSLKKKWRSKAVKCSNANQLKAIWDFILLTDDKEELHDFVEFCGGNNFAGGLVIQLLQDDDHILPKAPFWLLFDKVVVGTSCSTIYQSDEFILLIWKYLINTKDAERQAIFAQRIFAETPSSYTQLVDLLRMELITLSDPIVSSVKRAWRQKVVDRSNDDQLKAIWDFLVFAEDEQELQDFVEICAGNNCAGCLMIQLLQGDNPIPPEAPFWLLFDKEVVGTCSCSTIYQSVECILVIWENLIHNKDVDRQTMFARRIYAETSKEVLSEFRRML